MAAFTIALLQLLPEGTEEKNREKGLLWCRKAKAMGADLALFPAATTSPGMLKP